MGAKSLVVPVWLDAKAFRQFSFFDAFVRRKHWKPPVLFAAMMGGFGAVCFLMSGTQPQAALLAWVLLGVGLVLPAVYFLTFAQSVKVQSKRLGLEKPRLVYTLRLDAAAGLEVSSGAEQALYPWNSLHAVYIDQNATYLFVTADKGFILPQSSAPKTLQPLLESVLPPEKLHRAKTKAT